MTKSNSFITVAQWGCSVATLMVLSIAVLLPGCGVISTLSAGSEKTANEKTKTNPETMVVLPAPIFGVNKAEEGAKEFVLMALFSSLSYSDHVKVDDRDSCRKTTAFNPIATIDPEIPERANWKRWKDERGCRSESGLYFETYVYGKLGEISEAVIAIRGTENHSWQIAYDWSSDLEVGVTSLEPQQYKLARTLIAAAIESIQTAAGKLVPIFLTGHSLGGGLAQQSAYAEEVETQTIVFNTSPVTNWSNLVHQNLVKTDDPKIIRVTEAGEGLAYVRGLTTRLNSRRFNRSDVEFYFNKKNPVKSHSMSVLTCNFALRAMNGPGKHHFTPEMAKNILEQARVEQDGEYICPKDHFNEAWRASYRAERQ